MNGPCDLGRKKGLHRDDGWQEAERQIQPPAKDEEVRQLFEDEGCLNLFLFPFFPPS
jgi:hypothetical protein